MTQQMLPLSTDEPVVTIRTHGNLSLQGWDQRQIMVQGGSRYNLNVRQEGDSVFIASPEDCLISIPARSKVIIERVGGDAYVRNLENDLICKRIGSDLHLSRTGYISIEQVGGDCEVLQVTGDIDARKIGGDFIGKNITGCTVIERVGGDLLLQNANAPITSRAGGDIHISLANKPSGETNLAPGGDLTLHMPEDSGAAFEIISGGATIDIELGAQVQRLEQQVYSGSVGDGSARFSLRAGGDVEITSRSWNEELLRNLESKIDDEQQTFESSFEDRFDNMAQQMASEVASRAERRVQAALRRLEHRGVFPGQSTGGGQFDPFNKGFPFKKNEPPAPPKPSEPVSDEERMMILKMVEARKISVEEAEKLLEALEGK